MRPDTDVLIVGSGVSGSCIAEALTRAGLTCRMLEAGKRFSAATYPREEIDGSAQLYWSGGIELNTAADIGLLRPKVVGGGSVVNQALVDRFDDDALDSWREATGIDWLTASAMAPWYERAEALIHREPIPREHHNGNARIFEEGFRKSGYRCAPLVRAQRNCRWDLGNDCIECLQGCPRDSKQSAVVTTLRRALDSGLVLESECEARRVEVFPDGVAVDFVRADGRQERRLARRLVLAAGAIGNTALLLRSGFRVPGLGEGFYTHPQDMVFGVYDDIVDAHRGPFQAWKSADPEFRRQGFKLENVFAPPGALAMLIPRVGAAHRRLMTRVRHLACVEVAVRDTAAGRIRLGRGDRIIVEKGWNATDRGRRAAGLAAIDRIFEATGARETFRGAMTIGLHLMGGCALGAIVDADFRLKGQRRIFAADSSVFPNAPGINPSLTILALALRAADGILAEAGRG